MRYSKVCSLSLSLLIGAGSLIGTGYTVRSGIVSTQAAAASYVPAQHKVIYTQKQKSALSGHLLLTTEGILNITGKSLLFFSPDAGCQEALQKVKDLPVEKRPYLVVFTGSVQEVEAELQKAGLAGVKYYRCRGIPPTITVPSLVWLDGEEKKEYACSAAVEKLDSEKYPILLARAELPNVPGPAGNNAIMAMSSINGAVVNPGEEFSFYGYVGIPSAERGYQPSRSLMETPEGPVWFEDIGGGICKTATLLNNAVQAAGLQATELHHHTRAVTFAPEGQDVAVARSSGWDYRFRNNLGNPVQVRMNWDDKIIRCEIWELKKQAETGDLHLS